MNYTDTASKLTKKDIIADITRATDRDLVIISIPTAFKDAAKSSSIKEFSAEATFLGKRRDLVLIAVGVGNGR